MTGVIFAVGALTGVFVWLGFLLAVHWLFLRIDGPRIAAGTAYRHRVRKHVHREGRETRTPHLTMEEIAAHPSQTHMMWNPSTQRLEKVG